MAAALEHKPVFYASLVEDARKYFDEVMMEGNTPDRLSFREWREAKGTVL